MKNEEDYKNRVSEELSEFAEEVGMVRAKGDLELLLSRETQKEVDLKKRILGIISRLNDPNNNKISEVYMESRQGGNMLRYLNSLTAITELPNQVNVTKCFNEWNEFDAENYYYNGMPRWIKHGTIPKRLYQLVWNSLENNGIWDMKSSHILTSFNRYIYSIIISRGENKHSFSVYGPHGDKELERYAKIVNRINWLSYFALSKVKSVQLELDAISREEQIIVHRRNIIKNVQIGKEAFRRMPIYSGEYWKRD